MRHRSFCMNRKKREHNAHAAAATAAVHLLSEILKSYRRQRLIKLNIKYNGKGGSDFKCV